MIARERVQEDAVAGSVHSYSVNACDVAKFFNNMTDLLIIIVIAVNAAISGIGVCDANEKEAAVIDRETFRIIIALIYRYIRVNGRRKFCYFFERSRVMYGDMRFVTVRAVKVAQEQSLSVRRCGKAAESVGIFFERVRGNYRLEGGSVKYFIVIPCKANERPRQQRDCQDRGDNNRGKLCCFS